jgi:hypothetical protein
VHFAHNHLESGRASLSRGMYFPFVNCYLLRAVKMYDRAMDMMHKSLVQRTLANNMLYIAELVPKLNQDTRS